jgi:hypothetical protein
MSWNQYSDKTFDILDSVIATRKATWTISTISRRFISLVENHKRISFFAIMTP